MEEVTTPALALDAVKPTDDAAPASAVDEASSPREEKPMDLEEDDALAAAPPRQSECYVSEAVGIFVRAASTLASRASRVIALPRTKTKPIEETESEASPTSGVVEADLDSSDATVPEPTPAAATLTLPWQTTDENGELVDDPEIQRKITELTAFRSTYVEHPGGEEEYVFDFAMYTEIAKELLLHDPSLREMHSMLIPSAVTEIDFWRNFFLRANAVRVEAGKPSYLPEAKSTLSRLSVFQKFKRDMLTRRRSSTDRLRRTILRPRNASADVASAADLEVDLGDLDLDMDGEIDKELRKRRPSRAVAPPFA